MSLFIFLLDNLNSLNFFKSLAQTLTTPVQFGLYQSGNSLKKQVSVVFFVRQAVLENKALKHQLGELMSENAFLRTQLKEQQIIADQYQKLSPQTYDLLKAKVLSSGRYLTIDKGLDDGLSKNSVVVFKDNYIGKVIEVNPKTSQVLLATDPDSKVAVFSQGREGRAKGIIEGQFGAGLLMDKILHQEKVEVGDLVYSEGTEGSLPKGLILGKVTEVLERQNEVFKQAKVESLFKIIDLDSVFVLRNT